jgi:hypothetical protein
MTQKEVSAWIRELFFKYISPLILVNGLVGNTLVIVVYRRKAFREKSIAFYSCALAIANTICCIQIVRLIIKYGHNVEFNLHSSMLCKLDYYFIYSVTPISSHLLVVISLDRMISIVYMRYYSVLKTRRFQLIVVTSIALVNLITYAPMVFFHYLEINKVNLSVPQMASSNKSRFHNFVELEARICKINREHEVIYDWLDMFNSALVPFTLMIAFTLAITLRLYRTRAKVCRGYFAASRARDFAFVSIMMNMIFLVLCLPIMAYGLSPTSNDDKVEIVLKTILDALFYISVADLFWINLLFNRLFRKEFLLFIESCKGRIRSSTKEHLFAISSSRVDNGNL